MANRRSVDSMTMDDWLHFTKVQSVILHMQHHADEMRKAADYPIMNPPAPVMTCDFGVITVRNRLSDCVVTVHALDEHVMTMQPMDPDDPRHIRLEIHKQGEWTSALVRIAAMLDAKYGPTFLYRERVH